MIHTVVQIENELGLHARAAAKLVKLSSGFDADIKFSRLNGNQHIDGKSILGVLMLAAAKGTELEITIEGVDEREAAQGILGLIKSKFGELR